MQDLKSLCAPRMIKIKIMHIEINFEQKRINIPTSKYTHKVLIKI